MYITPYVHVYINISQYNQEHCMKLAKTFLLEDLKKNYCVSKSSIQLALDNRKLISSEPLAEIEGLRRNL